MSELTECQNQMNVRIKKIIRNFSVKHLIYYLNFLFEDCIEQNIQFKRRMRKGNSKKISKQRYPT